MTAKQFILFLLTPFLLIALTAHGQHVITYDLPKEDIPLDVISLKENQIHLVGSRYIYQVSGDSLKKIRALDSIRFGFSSQTYSQENQDYFFNNQTGGYSKIDLYQSKNTLAKVSRNFRDGLIMYGEKHLWIAEQDIYRNEESFWEIIHELKSPHNKYWDGKIKDNNIWLSNYGNGVFFIMNEDSVVNIKKSDGLFDNYCSSIAVFEDRVISGHNGAISIIDLNNGQIKTKTFEDETKNAPILEIEKISNGALVYLTPDQIFSGSEEKITRLDIPRDKDEEYVAIHNDASGLLWVLSNKKLLRIDLVPFRIYDFPDLATERSNLYSIRNNIYYSNNAHVFGYIAQQNRWEEHFRKAAPIMISVDSTGNTILGFADNSAIKLDKNDAAQLARYTLPENEKINNISEIQGKYYVCTEENLYVQKNADKIEIVSNRKLSFQNIKEYNGQTYAFATEGIFEVTSDSLLLLADSKLLGKLLPGSHQIIQKNKIIIAGSSQLILYGIEDASIEKIDFSPLNIHDILLEGNQLYLLADKSILVADWNKILDNQFVINASLPLPHQLIEAKLFDFNTDELWIKGKTRVLSIQKTALTRNVKPSLSLDKIIAAKGQFIEVDTGRNFVFLKQDLPLRFEFFNNNYWTQDLSYVFHVAGPESNESEWQNSSSYVFNPEREGQYLLNAKMRDPIFGEDIFSDTIKVEVLKPSSLSKRSLLIIPLFLIFSMILGYFASKS